MMTPDQGRNVSYVYNRLMAGEDNRAWSEIDNTMCKLDYLDDDQLVREAEVTYCHHAGKNPRCNTNHPILECFIPSLVEASASILDLYRDTGFLPEKNRYLIQYYIAMDHEKIIITDL